MELHLFGASTATGQAFQLQAANADFQWLLHAYSRHSATNTVDFTNPSAFRPAGKPGVPAIWISFAPIWLLAPFIEQLTREHPGRLAGMQGLIACSSSSVITKRYAANRFDRELVERLSASEELLLGICRQRCVPCIILQPTLIYGQVGPYGDRNLSKILQLLRWMPCLPLPAETGLRQPIHASQLAAVSLHLAYQLHGSDCDRSLPERMPLGGDMTISYTTMINILQKSRPQGDPALRCRLIPIPNRLFFTLASPLLLCSPKMFEALLRMSTNLSGFTPAHQLIGSQPQRFPVLPLS